MIAPALHAARLQLSTGAEYFNGDFGEVTSTEVLVVPFAARFHRQLFAASLGSAAVDTRAGQASLIGVQGNWRAASTAAGSNARSVDLFLNLGVAEGWRLDVSGSAGLSKASPDYAIGLGVTWRPARR